MFDVYVIYLNMHQWWLIIHGKFLCIDESVQFPIYLINFSTGIHPKGPTCVFLCIKFFLKVIIVLFWAQAINKSRWAVASPSELWFLWFNWITSPWFLYYFAVSVTVSVSMDPVDLSIVSYFPGICTNWWLFSFSCDNFKVMLNPLIFLQYCA